MLATTQWPLERAAHLTSLVWVCVLWLPESLMDLSALWHWMHASPPENELSWLLGPTHLATLAIGSSQSWVEVYLYQCNTGSIWKWNWLIQRLQKLVTWPFRNKFQRNPDRSKEVFIDQRWLNPPTHMYIYIWAIHLWSIYVYIERWIWILSIESHRSHGPGIVWSAKCYLTLVLPHTYSRTI